MLLSQGEIDLLRLLRWCSFISEDDLLSLFGKSPVENLCLLHLITCNKKAVAYSLTNRGQSFLDNHFEAIAPCVPRTYREGYITRRIHTSKIALTAYRAGLAVFNTDASVLTHESSFYLIAQSRIKGFNPWGSTRIAALLRMSGMLYGVHYIFPGVGGIALADELNLFNNNTSHIKNVRRGLLFVGQTYEEVLSALSPGREDTGQRLASYAEAYQRVSLPIHLLSCDDTGALQLRIMAQQEYRKRLTMAALKNHYKPPPGERPEWDAIFQGAPFVMGADMNLRRIDAAIQSAKNAGMRQVAVAALKEQAQAVLSRRYRDTGIARVFSLSSDALSSLGDMTLYKPSRRQFETSEGDVIDAPLIQADRKSGKQGRK